MAFIDPVPDAESPEEIVGEKDGHNEQERPPLSRPVALRQMWSWLDPWIMLWHFCRAWSNAPPPPQLRTLLDAVGGGHSLDLYVPT